MREQLRGLGYTFVDANRPADLYIVNSCTVTHQADRDTRRLARRAKRLNPLAYVIVVGCYSQVAPEALRAIPEIDLVCGQQDKYRLADILPDALKLISSTAVASGSQMIHEFTDHTRCFIKVQEGCNARCTYCIVPEARGPSRSVPVDKVLAQAQQLAPHHAELVLIGTHLGQYGRDLPDSGLALFDLLLRLGTLPQVKRLRLSSIEPCEVDDHLMELLTGGGQALSATNLRLPHQMASAKLCRHLHIPLQSGSDEILERMNRPYQTSFYCRLVNRIAEAQPFTGVGADVMVGFPGEQQRHFDETYALLESLPIAYLHVFTYSPRHGTPAASMPGQIPHQVAVQRNAILRALSERKRAEFAQRMQGQILETILQKAGEVGWLHGVTDNFLQLRVQAPQETLNRIVACRIIGVDGPNLIGSL